MNRKNTDNANHTAGEAQCTVQPMTQPSLRLWIEWALIFVALPLIAFSDKLPVSKFAIFAPPIVYALAVHYRMRPRWPWILSLCTLLSLFIVGQIPDVDSRVLMRWAFLIVALGAWPFFILRLRKKPALDGFSPLIMLVRFAASTAILVILVRLFMPEELLVFPRERPMVWLAVMIAYPVISALPQEFLYRWFYWRRYRLLWRNEWRLIASSVAVFSWLHLMYDNWQGMLLTLIGGWFFADTYRRSGNLFWPWIEHAIYGQMLFTIGLGVFFYEVPSR